MLDRLADARSAGSLAVRVVVAVAVVSIATGVAAILTDPALTAAGPAAEIQAIAEFSATVVGFALLVVAWGMRRGYRVAYVAAAALVALEAVHGVVQLRLLSIPLVVLSVAGLAVLVATSERFTRSAGLTLSATQFGAVVAVVGVGCYGTAGAYALRGGFDGVGGVVDAVYFTVVTATTVGYGDVHPTSLGARLFAASLVVLGPAAVAVAAGSLFGPAVEARLAMAGRRVRAHRDGIERVAVVGFEGPARAIAERLAERAAVTIVAENQRLEGLPADVEVHAGEPTDEALLERAGVASCGGVVVADGSPDAVRATRETTAAPIVAVAADPEPAVAEGADVVIDPRSAVADAAVAAVLESSAQSASAASQSG
ncbi:ion channel [Saliphagus sp. LR7]|uniref:ion channel n=1 Tax=Saliphagus sp. LR7 TaxID=2282654 RepID=UPI000DF7609F|nr:ion channel [Saliphagus sp. LR7]